MKELINKIKEKLTSSLKIDEKNLTLVLFIVIILLVNIAGVNFNFRLDLTRNNTYSLSDKSIEVVSNLKENLKIRVLFTEDLPAEHESILRYLKDMLQEYDYYGNEYFSYVIVNESEELEKQAADFGIKPVTSRELANDQVKLRKTYMGIVIQQADLIEKVEAVTDPVGLEYSITSLMEKITSKTDGLLKLDKPISLRLYLDDNIKLLPISGIEKVEEAVKEAVAASNVRNYDKIEFQLIKSLESSEAAELTEMYGLNRLKWPVGKTKSGQVMKAGEGVLGIVVEAKGRVETIELNVQPTLFGNYVVTGANDLEDKINDAVSSLVSVSPKLGYITGHGVNDINDERSRTGAGLLKQILSDMYKIKNIDLTKESIPTDIGTIIINGPKDQFTDPELFKIDQFLMKGNSAIFFIDSFREVQMPGQQNMLQRQQPTVIPLTTGLEKLLKHYGVTVNKNIVLDKNCEKIPLGNMIKDYPLVPRILESGLNRDNLITKYLKSALFIKGSSISTNDNKIKEAGITKSKLISSSDESWLMTGRINFHPLMMDPSQAKDMQSHDLAVLLSGNFESYFKDKDVPLSEEDAKKMSKSGSIKSIKKLNNTVQSGKTKLIVVGSSEITQSGFIMFARKVLARGKRGEVFSNDHLLHSMVDYLSGNYYIPEMRSKSLEYNPLEKQSDNTRFVLKSVNIGGVPIVVIIIGFIIWKGRLARKRRLMAEFSGESSNE